MPSIDPNNRVSSYNNSDPPAQAKKESPLMAKMGRVAAGVFSRVGQGLGKVQGKVNVIASGAEKIGDSLQGFTLGVVKRCKESLYNKPSARSVEKHREVFRARNEKMREGLDGLERNIKGVESLVGGDRVKQPELLKKYENELKQLKKEKDDLDIHPGMVAVQIDMQNQFERLEAAIKNLKAKLGNP